MLQQDKKGNTTQTPSPDYHSDDNFVSELVRKIAEQMHASNTSILSYEPPESPVWINDYLKRPQYHES